jgi:hypothetical protein
MKGSITMTDKQKFTPKTSFPLKLSLPQIYPETRDNPFVFHLRVQMVQDAEDAQRNFVALPDDQKRGDAFHQFDVEMIVALSTAAPENFPDFPTYPDTWPSGLTPTPKKQWLKEELRRYFYPDDQERREGMRFICRRAMALYLEAIQPAQYL